ncbi:hydantoinase B/oxoprolinase family protein [Ancylobacter sp. Lp-2]|uniref:hydantoinase B/oxoprolinase family protein n=1 Tax=Ancylobacter sp. Lp-2 TaxID=2881339 RepID=UPI001E596CD8|nr:hydantoinase B/oxoprolinase family protein [Ancylobacter sp. Lp-2]MCB4767040.1 hydantoinase B/oxoprolinase family protein [Ancylobacter sp. Lp-2]
MIKQSIRSGEDRTETLDPVTFEVLKNSFTTIVDQMAEQILRTCHSFVMYARDFSSALCDREGNTVMQGSGDIAVHVGTLHFTAKAVINAFGDDIAEGDVFAINDPYLGGTHFCDVRIVRPIFAGGELIGFSQSNGHWADIGGSVPGSFDVNAKEHFGEGLRIPPLRIVQGGRALTDVMKMIVSNTRAPEAAEGDLHAQMEATRIAEIEMLRLVAKYGQGTVVTAMEEVQNYVERLTRQRVAEMPDGTWETTDYLDFDPAKGEGLVPVKVKMTIKGDTISYDLSGSAEVVATFLNGTFGSSFSGLVTGTKMFFPDLPLNSGFYRVLDVNLGPTGTVVNAVWPTAVTGFCSGSYGKVVNAVFELWSEVQPQRAMACCVDIEYLLVGGRDTRTPSNDVFMWYDWMVGGWGGRNGKDGSGATSAVFGVGEAVQPLEGQERLCPVVTTEHQIATDSGGPGRFRGGCGVRKGGTLTGVRNTVMSYCCDRSRSITWGMKGGLPSIPHGVWLTPEGGEPKYMGAIFSNVSVGPGDHFTRPSAGGGGLGDPLERDPEAVLEDVIDEYVSVERARKDYGVVIREIDRELDLFEIDAEATATERRSIRAKRVGWLSEDPEQIAQRFREGKLTVHDLVRQYAVILDWGTGELLPKTTKQFREMIQQRTVKEWLPVTAGAA